ncbi:inactive serine/threonine-protein kinase TEX14-like [Branchiostoma floridae]|uniref:Inactive serine/threonine-protein kinase TEX14-like n=1 Tax=Branchiostoma floridae TaxID=7739 RepID=A0A9J7KP61_BRAFL|nr:inactive serine/threonine-protein kinase TEX14-like [Branchiostoma floridae]
MISLGWLSEDGQGGQLHAATRKGKVHVVKKLLKEGTRVDYPNSRDQTALFCACYLGKEKTVKLLLKYGANANERSDNGSTPVHAAAWSCKTGILLRLVRAGGNIRLHDNEGRTPKDWALERDKKKNKKMLILLDQMYMHAVALSNGEVTTGASGDSVMVMQSATSVVCPFMNL